MTARHPNHCFQKLLTFVQSEYGETKWVPEAVGFARRLLELDWFAQKAKVTESDGMYEVRNEKGYCIATFADKQPAKRFAELINLVSGGGE